MLTVRPSTLPETESTLRELESWSPELKTVSAAPPDIVVGVSACATGVRGVSIAFKLTAARSNRRTTRPPYLSRLARDRRVCFIR
jgi:hypothetical protein